MMVWLPIRLIPYLAGFLAFGAGVHALWHSDYAYLVGFILALNVVVPFVMHAVARSTPSRNELFDAQLEAGYWREQARREQYIGEPR